MTPLKFSIDDVPAAEPISSSTQDQSESTDADSVEDTSKKTTSRRKVAAKKAVPVKKSTVTKSGQGCLVFPTKADQENAELALKNYFKVAMSTKSSTRNS